MKSNQTFITSLYQRSAAPVFPTQHRLSLIFCIVFSGQQDCPSAHPRYREYSSRFRVGQPDGCWSRRIPPIGGWHHIRSKFRWVARFLMLRVLALSGPPQAGHQPPNDRSAPLMLSYWRMLWPSAGGYRVCAMRCSAQHSKTWILSMNGLPVVFQGTQSKGVSKIPFTI